MSCPRSKAQARWMAIQTRPRSSRRPQRRTQPWTPLRLRNMHRPGRRSAGRRCWSCGLDKQETGKAREAGWARVAGQVGEAGKAREDGQYRPEGWAKAAAQSRWAEEPERSFLGEQWWARRGRDRSKTLQRKMRMRSPRWTVARVQWPVFLRFRPLLVLRDQRHL